MSATATHTNVEDHSHDHDDHHDLPHLHRPGHVDVEGSKIGMWLFLFTEFLLFGGMFLLYGVYLSKYFTIFEYESHQLDRVLGCINTVFLLSSSLTMALSIAAIQRGKKNLSLVMLGATIVFSLLFFVVKGEEYSHKYDKGVFPMYETLYQFYEGKAPEKVGALTAGSGKEQGFKIFYFLYFTMTGLHALHVGLGAVILIWCFYLIWFDKIRPDKYIILENSGLYWHLVDLIWIFLFPLFYLIV